MGITKDMMIEQAELEAQLEEAEDEGDEIAAERLRKELEKHNEMFRKWNEGLHKLIEMEP